MQARLAVREASPVDLEDCLALARPAAPHRPSVDWHASLTTDIADPQHLLVVAERAGDAVAYGGARLFEPGPESPRDTAPGGYHLTGVFVRDDQRRLGAGSALTEARLDWIAARATEAWFFANARNTASIGLRPA